MVITKKYIILFFVILVAIQFAVSSLFSTTISERKKEFYNKSFSAMELGTLELEYSKKAQKKELKRIYDFLDMLEVTHKLKKVNKKKELIVNMPSNKAQKIINFVFNRKINIKDFEIEKVAKEKLVLKVVFL